MDVAGRRKFTVDLIREDRFQRLIYWRCSIFAFNRVVLYLLVTRHHATIYHFSTKTLSIHAKHQSRFTALSGTKVFQVNI